MDATPISNSKENMLNIATEHLLVVHVLGLQNVEWHGVAPETKAQKGRDVTGGLTHPVVVPGRNAQV